MIIDTEKANQTAYEMGREAGANAASWAIDGNTTDDDLRRILTGYDDGDPEVMDSFNLPDLSGQWADGLTPAALVTEILGTPSGADLDENDLIEIEGDLCCQWEDGVADGFWSELIRACRARLGLDA